MRETRELKRGFPYGRARNMAGGSVMCFAFYATEAECEAAIAEIPPEYPKQFVVYFRHLDATA